MSEEEKYTLDKVVKHPFTGLYWDYQTESYMFFVCGRLVVQLDKKGNVTPAVQKESATFD